MSDKQQKAPYPLRMPDGMREKLKDAAHENQRSLNAEIVSRLQESLDDGLEAHGLTLEGVMAAAGVKYPTQLAKRIEEERRQEREELVERFETVLQAALKKINSNDD